MLAFVLLVLLLAVASVSGRGIWPKRKKEEEAEVIPGLDGLNFEPAAARRSASAATKNTGVNAGAGLEAMFDSYVKMMEDLIESPDFDSMVTPESLKTMFKGLPGGGEGILGEMTKLLDSPELQDPEKLKATIKEGIRTMKQYSSQMLQLLSDPSKLEEALEMFPPEAQAAMKAVMGGDTSQLKDIMKNIPGLSGSQGQVLEKLLDGDAAGLAEEVGEIFHDESQIENARQEFLKEPKFAEMFGISEDILNDKEKWAEMMSEGLEQMGAINSAYKEQEPPKKVGNTRTA